jgi:hypothetical protein
MAFVRFDNLGEVGINFDTSPYELPPEVWSNGNNVRFADGRVKKILGHVAAFGTPTIAPYHLMFARAAQSAFWVYAGLNKVYVTDMASHFNLTRQTSGADVDYAATAAAKWNGGVLNGIPILNNGVDAPQMWSPVQASQRLQELANWNTWPIGGSAVRAAVIRPAFRNFLVALNITEGGTNYPHLLAWSNPADPGSVPDSWDYSDETNDAGRVPVADSNGDLLDLVMLGGRVGIVYKSDTAYMMQLTGGEFLFNVDPLQSFESIGLLATGCVRPFPGWHFMATQDDVIIHNSRDIRSVLSRRARSALFNGMSRDNRKRSFVVPNPVKHEMWFFYVPQGEEQPTRALVYNWDTGAISFRDFGGDIAHAALGGHAVDIESQVWDDDTQVWDADNTVWDTGSFNPANNLLLMGRSDVAKIYLADEGNRFDSSIFHSFVERVGLAIIGRDRTGSPKVDHDSIKLVSRMNIRATGTPFTVSVGYQDVKDGPVNWEFQQVFDPAVGGELNPYVIGKYIAVRFESSDSGRWELEGYDLDVEVVGRY